MAMLKAKVINYHRDYNLIERTRDQVKPRGQLPVEKLFLESHMVVKRVVIDVTKEQVASGQEWSSLPKGNKLDKAVPSHQKIVVLNAIKIMIICYELMNQEIRDRLTTDDEILTNTEYLKDLAACAKREEDRRRGVKPFVKSSSPSRSRRGSRKSDGGEERSSKSRSRSAGGEEGRSRRSKRSASRGRDGSSPPKQRSSRRSASGAEVQTSVETSVERSIEGVEVQLGDGTGVFAETRVTEVTEIRTEVTRTEVISTEEEQPHQL